VLPALFVTTTLAGPAAPAGDVAVMDLLDEETAADTPPNVTPVVDPRL
jgi:hypothetical protein